MITHNLVYSPTFAPVREIIAQTHLVAWDGCHKMYMALDTTQADWFRENYSYITEGSPDEMLNAIARYWSASCSLKFIQAVRTNALNPNEGFIDVIPQGYDWGIDQDDES